MKLIVSTAALALGVSPTRLRLFLLRHGPHLAGEPSARRQGRRRPIPEQALEPLLLAFLLARDLRIPDGPALQLAERLLKAESAASPQKSVGAGPAPATIELSPILRLSADLPALRLHLRHAIADALEAAPPPPPRGRPRRGAIRTR